MRLQEEVIAAPGQGEVRVAVRAIGLNFADIFAVRGNHHAYLAPSDSIFC